MRLRPRARETVPVDSPRHIRRGLNQAGIVMSKRPGLLCDGKFRRRSATGSKEAREYRNDSGMDVREHDHSWSVAALRRPVQARRCTDVFVSRHTDLVAEDSVSSAVCMGESAVNEKAR